MTDSVADLALLIIAFMRFVPCRSWSEAALTLAWHC